MLHHFSNEQNKKLLKMIKNLTNNAKVNKTQCRETDDNKPLHCILGLFAEISIALL